jgi:hypothetical protein
MTFSLGWYYQLGLKGTPARSACPRPREHPLATGCGTTRSKVGWKTGTKGPFQPGLKTIFLLVRNKLQLSVSTKYSGTWYKPH